MIETVPDPLFVKNAEKKLKRQLTAEELSGQKAFYLDPKNRHAKVPQVCLEALNLVGQVY